MVWAFRPDKPVNVIFSFNWKEVDIFINYCVQVFIYNWSGDV